MIEKNNGYQPHKYVQATQEREPGSQDQEGRCAQKVVQGRVGRCPYRKALRSSGRGEARNAVLPPQEAGLLKNTEDGWGNERKRKAFEGQTEDETGATGW
jgi:hypothetical protein